MGDPACRTLVPVAECVWQNTDGTRTVVWGYDNPSTLTLRIDPGSHNGMSPGADDQGQPQLFDPGRHMNAFTQTVSGTLAEWRLGNTRVDLTSSTPTCATQPVYLVGSATALGVFLLVMTVGIWVGVRPRRRVPALVKARAR
jgi:hypothetical protein